MRCGMAAEKRRAGKHQGNGQKIWGRKLSVQLSVLGVLGDHFGGAPGTRRAAESHLDGLVDGLAAPSVSTAFCRLLASLGAVSPAEGQLLGGG